MEHIDLLIVGAGWHGLALAKTYLEANSSTPTNVAILDYAESIGGTWAQERLYPGLKTNNMVGSFEFSDFSMDLERYSLKPGQHIPGEVVHRYLSDFADHYGLTALIRWRTKVDSATLLDDGSWRVVYSVSSLASGADSELRKGQLTAAKLVIATGLTSQPYMPAFLGQEIFQGNLFHSKELKHRAHDLTNSRNVVVIGGNKSAWDVCYTAACSGAQTHMVMRPSGGGPSWVWKPIKFGPFTTSLSRLSLTRFFTWFDPNPFGKVWKSARNFLHRTAFGRRICRFFWNRLDRYVEKVNEYREDERVGMLQPWTSTFWMGNSLSIHNYESDWFELVKSGMIVVHHADVLSLSENTVKLSNGETLVTDTIVACTGWKSIPSIKFQPPEIASLIGLPGNEGGFSQNHQQGGTSQDFENIKHLDTGDAILSTKTRNKVLQSYSELASKPVRIRHSNGKEELDAGNFIGEADEMQEHAVPYRLYRFVIPPSKELLDLRNLAFIGAHLSIHAVMLAQAQALWITAFFQDKLPVLNPDSVLHETYFHSEYERIRRPKEAGGSGERFPDLVFDSLPYVDLLLDDLGMRTKRKESWWKEVFQPYTLGDYRGLVQEWWDGRRTKE
ncbi:hypothetical protein G7Y89_g3967 [Cudoniella acicularis]|uniref:FAD/NAD(P)-binding domain-containing protein n=1 Tax=Cudoniella acicularis TaxID=354080 RepID=A0A8H4W5G1_9HELO|nr:hypothetical protein G7Y89_g3967 [Cudoniella acicularis]